MNKNQARELILKKFPNIKEPSQEFIDLVIEVYKKGYEDHKEHDKFCASYGADWAGYSM